MNCTFDFYSDIGHREDNQDNVLAEQTKNGFLFVVADGLGGHSGGARASLIATTVLNQLLSDDYGSADTLEHAIQQANTEILKQQVTPFADMKTTVAAVYLSDTTAYIANVGDSRIYAFLENELVFQSTDHSATQLAVVLGEITKEQMRTHVDRNRLTRALGASEELRIESYQLPRTAFDALLLCSDGFWEDVLEKDACDLLKVSTSPNEWLYQMRCYIQQTQNHDNHSAIAAFCERTASEEFSAEKVEKKQIAFHWRSLRQRLQRFVSPRTEPDE